LDFGFFWIVFIHVVRGRPGGLLQFSKGTLLRSWHLFHLALMQSGRIGRNAMLFNGDTKLKHNMAGRERFSGGIEVAAIGVRLL